VEQLPALWKRVSLSAMHSTAMNRQCFWSKFHLLPIIRSRITGKNVPGVQNESPCITFCDWYTTIGPPTLVPVCKASLTPVRHLTGISERHKHWIAGANSFLVALCHFYVISGPVDLVINLHSLSLHYLNHAIKEIFICTTKEWASDIRNVRFAPSVSVNVISFYPERFSPAVQN
jgi:hypothetical protein